MFLKLRIAGRVALALILITIILALIVFARIAVIAYPMALAVLAFAGVVAKLFPLKLLLKRKVVGYYIVLSQ